MFCRRSQGQFSPVIRDWSAGLLGRLGNWRAATCRHCLASNGCKLDQPSVAMRVAVGPAPRECHIGRRSVPQAERGTPIPRARSEGNLKVPIRWGASDRARPANVANAPLGDRPLATEPRLERPEGGARGAGNNHHDPEPRMLVERTREPDFVRLQFLRWLAEQDMLEHRTADPPSGAFIGRSRHSTYGSSSGSPRLRLVVSPRAVQSGAEAQRLRPVDDEENDHGTS
jgi:hypothetical protein